MSGTKQHPYHLVEPSPWPAVGAAAGFVVTIGAAMFMHEKPFAGINGFPCPLRVVPVSPHDGIAAGA